MTQAAVKYGMEKAAKIVCHRCKKNQPLQKIACTHPTRKGEFVYVHSRYKNEQEHCYANDIFLARDNI